MSAIISASSRRRPAFPSLARKALFGFIWMGLLAICFKSLLRYETEAGGKGAIGELPADLQPTGPEDLLVLALHPRCPCSAATVDELRKIYSRVPGRLKITALVFKPEHETDGWIKSGSMKALEPMQPRIVIDTNGSIAAKMGFATSGQVRLYNRKSDLLYDGGITGGRGHRGDNAGEQAVLELIRGDVKTARCSPTYGCSLVTP